MAATGKIIKDGSTNNVSKPVYVKSDGTLADATVVLPSGIICMWSGATTTIPSGWYLCNGSNGTPDLRNRFIIGAGSTYAVDNTGGETTVTLTVNQIPSHSHSIEGYSPTGSVPRVGKIISSTANTGSGASYNTSDTGGNSSHNNMPPYYALCFIMKG